MSCPWVHSVGKQYFCSQVVMYGRLPLRDCDEPKYMAMQSQARAPCPPFQIELLPQELSSSVTLRPIRFIPYRCKLLQCKSKATHTNALLIPFIFWLLVCILFCPVPMQVCRVTIQGSYLAKSGFCVTQVSPLQISLTKLGLD